MSVLSLGRVIDIRQRLSESSRARKTREALILGAPLWCPYGAREVIRIFAEPEWRSAVNALSAAINVDHSGVRNLYDIPGTPGHEASPGGRRPDVERRT